MLRSKHKALSEWSPLPHVDAVFTNLRLWGFLRGHHRRYAGTVTSPFLFAGTLLDPEGLYDDEVCTPDNLQKYAIPNPPTYFRQFLKKPVCCLLFNIAQIEGCFMDCKKTNVTFFYSGVLGEEEKKRRRSSCFSESNRIGFNG